MTDRPHDLSEAGAYTRKSGRSLRDLLGRYVRRHRPPAPPQPPREPPPEQPSSGRTRLIALLRVVPAVLTCVFILSFFWDFSGVTVGLFGTSVALDGLLRILSISGLIGFLTNWLAIAMLFHPQSKRPIVPQGLIPAQRERIIHRLAQAVSEELINEELIKQKIEESRIIPRYREQMLTVTRNVIEDPDFRVELKRLVSDYVTNVLGSEDIRRRIVAFTVEKMEAYTRESFGGLALKAYRYFNEGNFQERIDRAVRELPTSVDPMLDGMDHLLDRVPEKMEEHSNEMEDRVTRLVLGFVEKIDVYHIIVENMRDFDEQQLENLLKRSTNEQLSYIKYLGGVLGVAGGLVIWQPLPALAAFAILGSGLYAADEALYRRQNRALRDR